MALYPLLQREDAGQRGHDLREVFNGLHLIVKIGAPWRWMPNDLPPWAAVYPQTQRWLAAGYSKAMVDDLRAVLRLAAGRKAEPNAALHARKQRAGGGGGGKRKKGSKIHMTIDTLGHLLALHVTPANAEDRGEVDRLARTCRLSPATRSRSPGWAKSMLVSAANAAAGHGIALEVVKLPEAKRGSGSCRGFGWWNGRSPR